MLEASVATCTGNLFGGKGVEFETYRYTDSSGTRVLIQTVIAEALTANISVDQNEVGALISFEANAGNKNGDKGSSGVGTFMTFDGGSFGVASQDGDFVGGVISRNTGGAGAHGKNRTPDKSGTRSGGSGGRGGAGATATTTFASGFVTLGQANAQGVGASSAGGEGGGGGNAATTLGVATGGSGGHGGVGGTATTIVRSGTITTPGVGSVSVFALSSGGDGGAGGQGERPGKVVAATGAQGGDGGDGGDAGSAAVTIDNATIATGSPGSTGASNIGVWVSSVGGDGGDGGGGVGSTGQGNGRHGGDGGFGQSATLTLGSARIASSNGAAIFMNSDGGDGGDGGGAESIAGQASGGKGGEGGSGISVSVDSAPGVVTIATTAAASDGIRLQSVAGVGGDGGAGLSSFDIQKGKGGNGGLGGVGGQIDASLTDITISTIGAQSQGIFARSYGGAGGEGGESKGSSGKPGTGGGGGTGGAVSILVGGSVTTYGSESNAVLGHSVGGFSGNAGGSSGFVAYGASSLSAGDGGNVSVMTIDGTTITTYGDYSVGLTAQSVGGGGGKGSTSEGLAAVGGAGSPGGNGGTASLTNAGTITTWGQGSRGASATSRGGSGGDGGGATGILSVGGTGGKGGKGSTVSLANTGMVITYGDQSDGLYASSTGGGGGSAHSVAGINSIGGAGRGGGAGGNVTVSNTADVSTSGKDADGVFVHSVGGGGGDGSTAKSAGVVFSSSVGGDGGGAGAGGQATYTDNGASDYTISTTGARARGVFVQSVGGGGGDGGNGLSASVGTDLSFSLAVAGAGKGGGAGGTVSATVNGDVTTRGAHASAIQAQSVGGGGGSGGNAVAAGGSVGLSVNVALGGSGGDGGAGGMVTVISNGALSTADDISHGILAHSTGGSGGHSGTTVAGTAVSELAVNTSVGGKGGNGGAGGAVSVTATGEILTTGDSAYGINAGSVGGSGGAAHFTGSFTGVSGFSVNTSVGGSGGRGGDGAAVTVSSAGPVSTEGHNAPGIAAASVGGSGGQGSTTVSGSAISGGAVNVTVGGQGGAGGSGGAVSLTNNGPIITLGHNAEGLLAMSHGGGGGASGLAVSANVVSVGDVQVTVNGKGGAGEPSGKVTLLNTGDITTIGAHASAIDAKSIAGGGGNAKGAVSASGLSMGNVGVTLGGGGGAGGSAGAVTVTSGGTVATQGVQAHGIMAMSLGGSGGEGGLAAEGSLTVGEVSGSVAVTLGGAGGKGGSGNTVSVTTTGGSITTSDFRSRGIHAQSIGGSGGAGGNVYSGNFSFGTDGTVNASVDIGGDGGKGAVGGAVTVDNAADITTGSFFSDGIFAHSQGGQGGAGGNAYTVFGGISGDASANVDVTVGGTGGSGNNAQAVSVTNSGAITTMKGDSAAIYALSVGGGGGRGGSAASLNIDLGGGDGDEDDDDDSMGLTVQIAVGGSGGSAGNGDDVTVTNTGALRTEGASSKGIVAHSVGGGGGDGGVASAYSLSVTGLCQLAPDGSDYACSDGDDDGDDADVSAELSITLGGGGKGGAAGDGGKVSVTNKGAITTTGDLGYGILAQSVGGGGGRGGEGSLGVDAWTGNTTVQNIANLNSTLTSVPSFNNIEMGIGGSGGASGDGGVITVTNDAAITTAGHHAYGIHAQSVGGGGGAGGAGSTGLWSQLTVGGTGAGGGEGGAVTVSSPGAITTTGDGAVGIFAQSVGGGGGTAGDVEQAFSDSWFNLNIGTGVGIQGDAGAAGDGGKVTVTTGAITTSGTNSHGVMAQSVGGSGGSAGISGKVSGADVFDFAGSNGGAGNGGAVTVTVGGPIAVSGAGAHAVIAQSVAGGGDATKTSGAVLIDVNADIAVSGGQGRAILAQSAANTLMTANSVTIDVAAGVTVSSTANGAETIGIFDGQANVLTNAGTIRHAGTASNDIVIRTGGTILDVLTVTNTGTIEGSVLADNTSGVGAIVFNNQAGGVFGLGASVDLGVGGLTNAGTMSAGTTSTIGASAFSGALSQTSTGVLVVNFDTAGGNDLITVAAGSKPALAGMVDPIIGGTLPLSGDGGSFDILVAEGGIGANTLTVANTATVNYSLRETKAGSGEAVNLGFEVDYTPWEGTRAAQAKVPGSAYSRITSNATGFGHYVDDLVRARRRDLAAGTDRLAFVDDLVGYLLELEDVGDLAEMYDRFAPLEVFSAVNAATLASVRFSDELMSCPDLDTGGLAVYSEEGSCAYAQVAGIARIGDRDGLTPGYDEATFAATLGGQVEFAERWFAGGAFGFENYNMDADRYDAHGNRFQLGAVVKREIGDAVLSGAVSGGIGTQELSRQLLTPNGTVVARADPDAYWASAHIRAAYVFDFASGMYVKPWVDGGVLHIAQDSFSETGAGPYGLDAGSADATLFTINPAFDAGAAFTVGGVNTEAKVRAGLLAFLGDDGMETSARLTGVGGVGPSFSVAAERDDLFADLGASIQAQVGKQATFEASFDALVGGNQQEYIGAARLNILF